MTPKGPAEAAAELAALAAVDLRAAETLAGAGDELRSVVLFHAQQAAEKWLKALLVRHGRIAPRTHALGALLDQCVESSKDLERLREDAEFLTPFAVAPRYVLRQVANGQLAKRALEAARRFREAVQPLLGAEPAR